MATVVAAPAPATRAGRTGGLLAFFALGVLFGLILTRGQVISWFRIQEMFRFDAFHMYGIIGSAIVTAAAGLWALRRLHARTLGGDAIVVPPKAWGRGYRYWLGGTLFGFGWAFTGACPGPLFALVGAGVDVMAVGVVSAVAGTWAYGYLRPRLPH